MPRKEAQPPLIDRVLRLVPGRAIERFYYSRPGQLAAKAYGLSARKAGLSVREGPNGALFEIDISKPFERAIPYNALEPLVVRKVLSLLGKGSCVIDVGAWIGYYSILAALAAGPNGRVIAVEPDRENVRRLGRNLNLNSIENVEIIEAGIGDSGGKGALISGSSSSTHSISPASGEFGVRITTLDEIQSQHRLSSLDLVIMDIEGYEYNALKGGRRMIFEQIARNFIIEVHPRQFSRYGFSEEDVRAILVDNGYRVELIDERVGSRAFHLYAEIDKSSAGR